MIGHHTQADRAGYTLDEMEFETMQQRCCINCKIDEDEGYKG